jgi:hypothetical protein
MSEITNNQVKQSNGQLTSSAGKKANQASLSIASKQR